MILVPQPEAGDRETLLSGSQGKWLAMLLSAMGIAEDQVYLASALPRHTPMADWDALTTAGLGKITRHHIQLAAPERLLLLGNCILPLAAHDPAKKTVDSRFLAHEALQMPLLTAPEPAMMRPRAKQLLWQAWLDTTR